MNRMICPHCGQWKPVDLPVSVNTEARVAVRDGKVVRLSGQEALILDVVLNCHPRTAGQDTIIARLWELDEPKDALNCCFVLISTANKKLKRLGARIVGIRKIGWKVEIYDGAN